MSERIIKDWHPEDYGLNQKTQDNARHYEAQVRSISLINNIIIFVLALVVIIFHYSVWLSKGLHKIVPNEFVVILVFVIIGFILYSIINLPFAFAKETVERKFDQSNQDNRSWFGDYFKGFIMTLIFALLIIEIIYTLLRTTTYWWLVSGIVIAIFAVLMVVLSPSLMSILSYRMEELKDEALKEKLKLLSDKAGIKVLGFYKLFSAEKTNKAIAALTGGASTRRILVSDKMMNHFKLDEIEIALGHEIGHHKNKSIPVFIVLLTISAFIIFYIINAVMTPLSNYFNLGSPSDIATLPLFALIFGAFFLILGPIQNTVSRILEADCDRYALILTKNYDAFTRSMAKLSDMNLRYANPHPLIEFIYFDHPSCRSRIEMGLRMKKAKNDG